MSKMTTMEKIYFVSAWVVAGCAFLALIFGAVTYRRSGLLAFGTVLDWLFFGATGCLALLHLSGWFRNSLVMFMTGWIVGAVAFLSMILTVAAGVGGEAVVTAIFGHVALGGFCTLILLHFSGKLGEAKTAQPMKPPAKDEQPTAGAR